MARMPSPKKYTGQERWTRNLLDIVRITHKPSCGQDMRIGDKELRFDQTMLFDLLRRREAGTENDSLRSRAYDQGGGGGSSELTQTEAAALRGLPEAGSEAKDDWRRHHQPDPIGKHIEEALEHFDKAAFHLRKFEQKLGLILNAGMGTEGHVNRAGRCEVCERPVAGTDRDLLHRGRYCGACNKDWQRSGRPHELAERHWQTERREKLGAEGKLWSQDGKATFYGVDEIAALQASGSLPMPQSA